MVWIKANKRWVFISSQRGTKAQSDFLSDLSRAGVYGISGCACPQLGQWILNVTKTLFLTIAMAHAWRCRKVMNNWVILPRGRQKIFCRFWWWSWYWLCSVVRQSRYQELWKPQPIVVAGNVAAGKGEAGNSSSLISGTATLSRGEALGEHIQARLHLEQVQGSHSPAFFRWTVWKGLGWFL